MTLAELRDKWARRHAEWRALGVQLNGKDVASEILADLDAVGEGEAERLLTPTEAAPLTNYHPESIARLVRTGKVPNYGTKHRPRVKLADLPKRTARSTRSVAKRGPSSASSVVPIDTIARDAVAGRLGRT